MSTPPPNSPWDQPQVPGQPARPTSPPPAGPAAGQWPPATPGAPTVPLSMAPASGGGGGKKGMWIGLGVLAVAVVGLVAFLVTRGGDDDDSSDRDRDRTEDDRDNRDDRDDRDDRGGDEGDPDDAVDVARDLVQALIEGDCGAAADLATANFADYGIEDACGEEAPAGTRITDARLDQEDPVVVVVTTEVDDESGDIPLLLVYEDGEWLVDDFSFDVPDLDVPTDDDTGAPASGDPEEIAQTAIQAVIDGDCSTALSLGTLDFIEAYGDEVCGGELLPPDAEITGVETIGDDPVIVSVDVQADGESYGIELTFAEEFGSLLIDSYSV